MMPGGDIPDIGEGYSDYGTVEDSDEREGAVGVDILRQFIEADNIADDMDDGELNTIGQDCVKGFDYDWESLVKWRTMIQEVLRLAKLEKQDKSYPWPGASNVMYPLITQASMQFAARAYPEIVQGNKVVRGMVLGDDPDGQKQERADRVSEHMSWQLLEEMDGWEESTDKLLNMLPVYGTMYRKVYYDSVSERPAQVLLTPLECVVNNNVRSFKDARRITHVLYLYENDVRERVNAGIWLDQDIGKPTYAAVGEDGKAEKSGKDDEASMHLFLEQHCWLDLDDDGYEEPYVVTVHKDTSRVMRIVARYDAEGVEIETGDDGKPKLIRIKPTDYFVKYPFVPAPDGCGIDLGFGAMLHAANETINSITNQLIDSGTLSNLPSGFVADGANVAGVMSLTPGEWRKTQIPAENLSKSFFLVPSKEPSNVLFQLLGATQSNFKELVGNVDVLSGGGANANTAPGTMLAQIEQGHKVYSSIYKRIYRALRVEFKILAGLNAKYLQDVKSFRLVGSQKATQVTPQDYKECGIDIAPVADPNQSTSMQRLAKAQAALSGKDLVGVDQYKLTQMFFGALQLDQDIVLPMEQLPKPPPDPVMEEVRATAAYNMGKLQLEQSKLSLQAIELDLKARDVRGKTEKALAEAILALAKAGSEQTGAQIRQLEAALSYITSAFDMHQQSVQSVLAMQGAQMMPRQNVPPQMAPTEPMGEQQIG